MSEMDEVHPNDSVQHSLSSFLCKLQATFTALCDKYSINTSTVSVLPVFKYHQKGKKRMNCDFMLCLDDPKFCKLLSMPKIAEELCDVSSNWNFPIESCRFVFARSNRMEIQLSRFTALKQTLIGVFREEKQFGNWQNETNDFNVFVTTPTAFRQSVNEDLNLVQLRNSYITEALISMLSANGYIVSVANIENSAKDRNFSDQPWLVSSRHSTLTYKECDIEVLANKWKTSLQSNENTIEKEGSIGVNAKTFLATYKHRTGYDKNISYIYVQKENVITDVCKRACFLSEISKSKSVDRIIHVVNESEAFYEQQCAVLCEMLSEDAIPKKHLFLIHQSVKDNQDISAKEYYDMYFKTVKEAFCHKNGSGVLKDDVWRSCLTNLTISCMMFELLSSSVSTKCKISLNSLNGNEKGGKFVQYNCGRLAALFRRYNSLVETGAYPPLPPIGDVDFSTLKLDQEWHFAITYILPYPLLIQEITKSIFECNSVRTNFSIHKLCQFLINLSNDLSVYYSKVRILTNPYPHLLPTMFARLWLLRCVQQVLHNGLALLNLKPVAKM